MANLPPTYRDDLERFKRDISAHQMQVIKDDGLYRHLRFKKPETTNQYFDIVTWPGTLCYTGDMGTYVFSRCSDMFEFFRSSAGNYEISYGYWAEKLQSVDKVCGLSHFSPRIFGNTVKEWFDEWAEGQEDKLLVEDTWYRINEEVLCYAEEDEHASISAALNFRASDSTYFPSSRSEYIFQDIWECDCRVYSYNFMWCCWALSWAIGVYDSYKQLPTAI